MKAAVMYGPREVRIVERQRPTVAAGELLVKIHHVGICGSDMHFLKDGRLGNWVAMPSATELDITISHFNERVTLWNANIQ